ncbi:SusC/RagA family TonB-linked outer membrane protein, partial [Flavitalea flava]
GVTVTVDKTGQSTATDGRGEFSIKVPDNGILIFSSVGFITQRFPVNGRLEIEVVLKESSKDLNEIVVIGYGARKQKDIVGAVSSISAVQIEKSSSISPEMAMQGQIPGVSVTSAGGDPSARPTVRIRGVSSFNTADPLYVIDGIPLAEGGSGATVDAVNDPTRRTPINIYTIINPNDIESISVLKDASASAIYGVRAANGVILITTKSGKKGRVRVDVDAYTGTQKVPKTYKVLNTPQFVDFYTHSYNANPYYSTGGVPIPIGQAQFFGPVWDPASTEYLGNSPTYDWQHALINNKAKLSNYNVRASGGTDNINYNFSAGYASNDGPIVGVNTQRYSIASNVTSKIGKYLEAGVNLRLIQERLNGGSGGDLGIYKAAPWQAIYDKSNPYGYAPLYKLTAPITPGSSTYQSRPGNLDTLITVDPVFSYSRLWGPQYVPSGNYLGALASSSNIYKSQSAIGTGYIQVQPLPGLKFKATFSGQQYTVTNNTYSAFDNWQFQETPGNPYGGVPNATPGTVPNSLGISNSITTNTVKSVNGDYIHSFGKHNLGITADASEQEYYWNTNSLASYVYSQDPSLRYFNAAGTEKASSSLNGHYVLIGYLGRISYNYDNRYYLEGVVRRDGSSRFAPGHQFGTFPSGSAGWRISREKFMESIPFINDLKIRGSYGILGNEQTTGGWQYLSVANVNPPSYNLGGGLQSNNLGIAYGNFANASLTWERLRSANVGIDALLLNNTVSLTIDYYHKVTKGIIQQVNLSPSTGFEIPANLNVADVLNRGLEFQAGYNRNFGNIGISLSANLTTVHNEVLTLADHQAKRSDGYSASNLEEGLPIGFIYGYKVGGIFQDQAQIDKYKTGTTDKISTQQKPGDLYFQNIYGQPKAGSSLHNPKPDSVVDANDETYLGKTIPGYYYGFNLSANYKGFDVSLFFMGVGDVQKFNATRAAAESMNGYGRNQFASVLNAWTPTNTHTNMPRAVYGDPNGNLRASNRWVENAGYFRLQNLSLGYNLPKKWLESTKTIQALRIYVTGINLFTVTHYSGLDPENDVNPTTRQFLVGVRASF